jgi:hypothetical protein
MGSVVTALVISFALIAATVLIHYEVLNKVSRTVPRIRFTSLRGRMLLVITGIFIAHLIEIALYAAAYYLMEEYIGLGAIGGARTEGWMDYFYFSSTSYTTLGVGDLYPSGPMRLVSGIESLNGFVLIGWSTSFTFLAMQRFWRETRTARR